MARGNRNRQLRLKYAVLGDGLTEQYYLKHLKGINGYNYAIKPSLFDNIEISQASEIICELLRGGVDGVVYLTDYDTIVNQSRKVAFDKLKDKFKDDVKVLICETMPSIEFWFLLHYQYTTRSFQDSTEALNVLKRSLPNFEKRKVWLEQTHWVEELCSDGKLEVAIDNAKRFEIESEKGDLDSHHPFSFVFKAIEQFEKWKG